MNANKQKLNSEVMHLMVRHFSRCLDFMISNFGNIFLMTRGLT